MIDILYTNSNAIRAALGVTEREIEDRQIGDLNMELILENELETVFSTHAALATAITGTPTAEETAQWRVLRLYCQYECAVQLLPQLQMLSFQKLSDGDAENQRFDREDLEKTKDQITGMRDKYRGRLNSAFETGSLFYSPMARAAPDYNPVTDEGAQP